MESPDFAGAGMLPRTGDAMKSQTLLVVALLLLTAACSGRDPIANISKKLDALAVELPQIDEVAERQKRLRADNNGWNELLASNKLIEDFRYGDQGDVATDFESLGSVDYIYDPQAVARLGLAETAAVAKHLAAAAEYARIVPWDSSNPREVMHTPIISLMTTLRWGAARVSALEVLGESARAIDELQTLFRVVDRVAVPPTLLGVRVTLAVRDRALRELLAHAGKPGWDRSVVTGMLNSLGPYQPRFAQMFAAELAFVRELMAGLSEDGPDTTLPALLPTPAATRNLEMEFDTLAAVYGGVIREDAEQPLRLMTDRDLRRVLELLQPLKDFADKDALFVPTVEGVVLGIVTQVTSERMLRAAIELRLLESEHGALTGQRAAVREVLDGVPGATAEFRGSALALVAESGYWRYTEGGIPEPDELVLEPRN